MTHLDWEKANRRDLIAGQRKTKRRRGTGKHSGRQPSTRQLSYAQSLAKQHRTDIAGAICCTRHLSQWIDGCKALTVEGFYDTSPNREVS